MSRTANSVERLMARNTCQSRNVQKRVKRGKKDIEEGEEFRGKTKSRTASSVARLLARCSFAHIAARLPQCPSKQPKKHEPYVHICISCVFMCVHM